MGMQLDMNDKVSNPEKSPFTALALNFFLPGAGYLYGGMILFAVLLVAVFMLAVFLYPPVALLIWVFAIIDGPLAIQRRFGVRSGERA